MHQYVCGEWNGCCRNIRKRAVVMTMATRRLDGRIDMQYKCETSERTQCINLKGSLQYSYCKFYQLNKRWAHHNQRMTSCGALCPIVELSQRTGYSKYNMLLAIHKYLPCPLLQTQINYRTDRRCNARCWSTSSQVS